MEKRWVMVIDAYKGIRKNAANMLSGFLSGLLSYVLPVKLVDELTDAERQMHQIIAVGACGDHALLAGCQEQGLLAVPNEAEGYGIYVGASPFDATGQIVAIAGTDESGILYGCMDFINTYCGDILYQNRDIWSVACFQYPLERPLNKWRTSAVPAIKTRAIWTWGHVIYDYRDFLQNMARLRLNEIVIWNDDAPLNAKDIVDHAHGLGIKVIWGFAWGWGLACVKEIEAFSKADGLQKLKEAVLNTYRTQYEGTGADGIYFQSFTEMSVDTVGGMCVAEVVTRLVNNIAGELLSLDPHLHIQFGLHATSVKTRLEYLKQVDERVSIVWEDCGAFPYHYDPDHIEDFDETYALTDTLLSLRGETEKFGAVLKGMLKLDWHIFEHPSGRYILGERTKEFIRERQLQKDKLWKLVRGSWLKNAEYFRKTVALMAAKGKEPIVQALVEDAMLENTIALPVAIYAQTLWTPTLPAAEIIKRASKSPFVEDR